MRACGDLDGGLLLERVGGELGRLGVDVDRGAVGAHGAGEASLAGEKARPRARRARSSPLPMARREGAVEVDVARAGSRACSRSRGWPPAPLALRGALDGALEGKLRGVEEHWDGISLERELEVRPWTYAAPSVRQPLGRSASAPIDL